MNAQENWKRLYVLFIDNPLDVIGVNCRNAMHKLRREAALERRIAALERENARLHQYLDEDSTEKARLRNIIHNAGFQP